MSSTDTGGASAAGAAGAASRDPSGQRRRWWHSEYTVFAVMVVLLVLAPLVIYPVVVMKCLCMALFACAFNLLIGYVGLTSFGHAMFLGGAGYACAHAAKVWGLPPELAILFGTAVAAALGTVIGWLAIRRQGIYFAMITLGLAQMIYFFCLQAPFTHGEDGIQAVPRGLLLGAIDLNDNRVMYGFVLVIFLIGFSIIYRVIHSPFGAVLTAIRENEVRTISLGYNTDHYKLIAFVLSAALAGMAGATKALVFQIASLPDVHWTMSGEVVLMTLVGGLGRYSGPVVGAFLLVGLEYWFSSFGGWVTVGQGVVFVLCVLTFRQGIMGTPISELKRPLRALWSLLLLLSRLSRLSR
jgi:branched-chain amino acid transport system permease protein